ncbi:hypothetical protein DL93DRAFT_344826 [Clavulina sp. PMI_390]|nr:hypothetical protein DL93DRAFT_344826 [Clavulina sp. PMI_390]
MTSPPTKSLDLPNGDSLSSARPTSLNWSLESLLSFPNHNFVSVRRISAQLPKEDLAKEIQLHEHKGIPLIIEGWHLLSGWNSDTFTAEWLAKKFEEPMNFWELYAQEDHSMTVSAFLDICRSSKEHAEADEKQRFYGKDITFPSEWEESLRILPPSVLPLSEGDSFTMLDPKDRPETIMGYMGIGDTFTPAHKDTSASTGYNIMVHTSAINSQDLPPDEGDTTNYNALIESGDASAFWFLTAAEDAAAASQYFSNKLGQTLDLQAHYASLEEFMGGNFKVYVCQQVLGDLVIIPRQSCHQVMNHGGLSTKVAWSRMPFRSIEAALLEELPVYRRFVVC